MLLKEKMSGWQNKIVLVTGATSGIGKATALAFARAGAKVVGTGRNQEALAALAPHLDQVLTLDVTDPESVEIVTATLTDRYGGIDVVVNNAGIGLFKSVDDTTEAELARVMAVNFFGAVRLAKATLPLLRQNKGVLVQVSSVAGKRGYPKHTAYCASKHALNGWSESLRKDLAGSGVGVVVVCPPAIDTPFFVNAGYTRFKEEHEGLKLMSAEAVADAILDASRRRPREVILSGRARALYALSVIAPGLLEQIQKLK